jgi:hypothetical protein
MRRRMGQQACSTVTEKFTLNIMVAAYERMFLGLMRRRPAAGGPHG